MSELIRTPHALPPARQEELQLRVLWQTLWRRKLLIFACVIAGVALAALVTALQAPVYESETTLLIEDEAPNVGLGGLLAAGAGPLFGAGGSSDLLTDLQLLESRQIVETVVDSLALQVVVLQPRHPRAEILEILAAPSPEDDVVLSLQHDGGGLYQVERTEGSTTLPIPQSVRIGQPFSVAGGTLVLRAALATSPPEQISIALRPFGTAVEAVRAELAVGQPRAGSKIVSVAYRSPDPILAAAIPNAATAGFIRYKTAANSTESRGKVEFLRDQVAQHEGQLAAAEAALRSFREAEQVVEPQTQAAEQVRRLAALQVERDDLIRERESLRRLLASIEQAPRTDGGPSPYRQLLAYPSFLSNSAVQSILQHLNVLENERADLLVQRTEQSIDVQGIDTRITELEQQLYSLARNYLEGLDFRRASVEESLARFGALVEQVPAREVEYSRLLRQRTLLEAIYTQLQTQLKEEEIQLANRPIIARVVDEALVPRDPASPRPLLNLILGGMVGLVLGVGVVLAREASSTRVRSLRDVEYAVPDLPVLGLIPRSQPRANRGALDRMRLSSGAPAGAGALVIATAPQSPTAEAYRALRARLFRLPQPGSQLHVLTSSAAEDGSEGAVSNLAAAIAQQGTRVLLVDADLRRGSLAELLQTASGPGLGDLLTGDTVSVEQAIHSRPIGHAEVPLDFLPAGRRIPNPAEALGSPRMSALLAEVRGLYEVIIVHAPPITSVVDAGILASHADRTILLARSGTTEQEALRDASDRLSRLGIAVDGVILHDVVGLGNGDSYFQAGVSGGNGIR